MLFNKQQNEVNEGLYTPLMFLVSINSLQVLPNLANALLSLSRMPSGEGMEEEPLYVNAKQYHRILKRRQARAKLEAEGKIPKQRQVYMFIMTLFFIRER